MIIFIPFFVIIPLIFTSFLLPWTIKFGLQKRFIDKKTISKSIPNGKVRIGGIAIYISFFLSLIIALLFFNQFINLNLVLVFFLSTTSIFILGLIDDIFSLGPLLRLIIQLFISTFVYLYGIKINYLFFLPIESENILLVSFISFLATNIWLIGTMNAINWLDGLDGLASGFTISSSIVLSLINIGNDNLLGLLLSLLILGSVSGFLKLNFYPSKLLMGDCGSNLIGFYLALLAILTFKTESNMNFISMIILFSIPLLDMMKVIFIRLIKSKNPFMGDESHFHHNLINYGFNHKQSVLFMYFLFILTSTLSYGLLTKI